MEYSNWNWNNIVKYSKNERLLDRNSSLRQRVDEEEMPATPESDLSLALAHTGDLPSCRLRDIGFSF